MQSRSNLLGLSAVFLVAGFLMLSCASSLHPDQLTVHVPRNFSGTLHISTCVSGEPAGEIVVNDQGSGKTSLCPAVDHAVEILVITGERQYRLSGPNVHIERTGDGIATSVQAQLAR